MDYLLLEEENGYREYPVIDGKAVGISDNSIKYEKAFDWQQRSDGKNVYLISGDARYFKRDDKIFISGQAADINIDGLQAKIFLSGNCLSVTGYKNLWKNGKRVLPEIAYTEYRCKVETGDEFLIDKLFLTILEKDIEVRSNEEDIDTIIQSYILSLFVELEEGRHRS